MDRILELLIRCIIWFSGFTKSLSRLGISRYEERQPGEKLKILLSGYNGARNTGADARDRGSCRLCMSVGEAKAAC